MALYSHKLSKPKYHNWVKATLAVLLTKEGIEPFVYKEIQEFQLKCLDDICYDNGLISGATCSRCCTENVIACPSKRICNIHRGKCNFHRNAAASVPCPNNICHHFKDKVQKSHYYNGPSYKNTDAAQWCSNPWEVAKCFMPPDGYKDVASPAETDFNGINSIIINYKGFQSKIKDRNIFEKARMIGRDVRHSPNLEIDATELHQYFTDLNTLLSDPGYLANDNNAQEAQQKLLQLQNDKLPLGEVYIRQVLDESAEVIKENMKTELVESKRKQNEEHLKLLEASRKNIETLFQDKEKHVYSQIEGKLSLAVDAIKKRKSEALEEFNTEASNKLAMVNEEIQKSGDEQVKRLKQTLNENDETKMNALQDDLISFYRDQHRTISLSPLLDKDTPLLEFYVMPDIYSVNNTLSGDEQEKTAVTPLRNVFYNNDNMYRKIYLTADAGLGKTALSKRLALTWCHAKKPHTDEGQYFPHEDIKAITEFCFVFLLLLRNCSSECEMDDLIWNQNISRLGHDYTRADLVNILCKERCLVILDGLDEWSHPLKSCKQGWSPIPHQKVRDRTAVLTTTRPWKLSVSGLQASQIDQKLELVELSQTSANALKKSVISRLCNEKNEQKLQQNVAMFTSDVEERQISDLTAIPLLLMYLLFLWCRNIKLGKSHCELYSQITELMLSRTVQNYIELSPKVDLPRGHIPQCLSGKTHCSQFYTLLTSLGQLAYETLFNEKKEENTLVFDGSVAMQYLTKDCLNFCLKTGLITQSKISVPGTLLEHKSKVSFAHKTVQEFFAALYMHSASEQTLVPETVFSKCKCIKDILEMSNILKFICGMNVNNSSFISREMMKIINEDEITRKYRISLESSTPRYGFRNPLKDFQDMCISCCKENDSLCLQDVFIEGSCEKKQYRENLKQLTTRNKQNIRSFYINMFYMRNTPYNSVQKVIAYFALNDLEHIEKIHFECEYNDREILPLLHTSLKCLYLSCSKKGSWSRLLFEKVTSLPNLEAIHINKFKMSHIELTLLYDYISQGHCMRQIELEELHCTDHCKSCTGYSLDLSQHSQLNKLTLRGLLVSELNINMSSLKKCSLAELSKPYLVLRFIKCVPADSKLNTYECREIKSPVAIETMLEILRLSVHVKHVKLSDINLGNREVLASEMVNIDRVDLKRVTMTASVLQGIIDVVQQQSQTVRVQIRDSDIEPESEFMTVKQKIKTSPGHFSILVDSEIWFEFETIKQVE